MAALSRINRDRRAVILVAAAIRLGFRLVPPILWDWSERAERLGRRAEMVAAALVGVRAGWHAWHAPRTVAALISDPKRETCRNAA